MCAVSLATWRLFTGVHARCVVLRVRCGCPLGSRSLVCTLDVLCCLCCVLGSFALFHQCARLVCCVAYAVSLATWLLFTRVLCCVFSVLGHVASIRRCARLLCRVACAVSLAT